MIVTGLILQDGAVASHSIEKYVRNFRYLESLGLPITLFLDRSIKGLKFASHVAINLVDLEDMHFWSLWKHGGILPRTLKEPLKDRLAYMAIINTKTLLMEMAYRSGVDRYTWVDFGLGYVMKEPEESFKWLYRLDDLPPGVTSPAIWGKSEYLDRISWRFCGGLFSSDWHSLTHWNRMLKREAELCYPQASWEVNYWARLESKYGIHVNTYQSDHNDSMLRFPWVRVGDV